MENKKKGSLSKHTNKEKALAEIDILAKEFNESDEVGICFYEEDAEMILAKFILSKEYDFNIGNFKLSELIYDVEGGIEDRKMEEKYYGWHLRIIADFINVLGDYFYNKRTPPKVFINNDFDNVDEEIVFLIKHYVKIFDLYMFLGVIQLEWAEIKSLTS